MADAKLVLLFGGLHLIGLVLVAMLFVMFMRSDTTDVWTPPEDDEGGGGGGNDRVPPRAPEKPPPGGLPLPDAVPARRRLREPGRLGDLLPSPERRPSHAPERTPVPGRRTPVPG